MGNTLGQKCLAGRKIWWRRSSSTSSSLVFHGMEWLPLNCTCPFTCFLRLRFSMVSNRRSIPWPFNLVTKSETSRTQGVLWADADDARQHLACRSASLPPSSPFYVLLSADAVYKGNRGGKDKTRCFEGSPISFALLATCEMIRSMFFYVFGYMCCDSIMMSRITYECKQSWRSRRGLDPGATGMRHSLWEAAAASSLNDVIPRVVSPSQKLGKWKQIWSNSIEY